MYLQGIVGPQALQSLTPGSPGSVRLGQLNDLIVSQLHGKWYEQCYRGNMYSFGSPPYTLSGCTVLTSASCTPIIAIWNPSYSTVNCVLSKAKMQIMSTTGSNTGVAPGGFVWASSSFNNAITTGCAPLNRKTLANAGSLAKGFNATTALTGLSSSLVIQEAATFGTMVAAQSGSAALTPEFSGDIIQEFDGMVIVQPGTVWALLNTISTSAVSVCTSLSWEEVPL